MAHDTSVLQDLDEIYNSRVGLCGYNKFGRNPDIDLAQEEVWVGPTASYNWPPVGSTMYLSSDDASDDELILIQGLDDNWELRQTTATLSGQTFVQIPNLWNRIYRVLNPNGTETAGNLYLSSTNVGAGGVPTDLTTVHAFVVAGQQGTQQTPFTIPIGFEGYVTDFAQSLGISVGGTRTVNIVIELRAPGGIFREVFRANLTTSGTSFVSGINPYPPAIPAMTDISILANSNVNNADVAISYTIALMQRVL